MSQKAPSQLPCKVSLVSLSRHSASQASKYKMQLQLIALELRNNETNLNKSISTQKIFMIHSAALIANLAMFFCHFHQLQYSLPQLLTFNPKMTTFFVRSVAPICASRPNIWTSQRAHLRRSISRHLLRRSPRNKARLTLLAILHPLPEPRRAKTEAKRPPGSDLAANP